jgi:hypothetical protein
MRSAVRLQRRIAAPVRGRSAPVVWASLKSWPRSIYMDFSQDIAALWLVGFLLTDGRAQG